MRIPRLQPVGHRSHHLRIPSRDAAYGNTSAQRKGSDEEEEEGEEEEESLAGEKEIYQVRKFDSNRSVEFKSETNVQSPLSENRWPMRFPSYGTWLFRRKV